METRRGAGDGRDEKLARAQAGMERPTISVTGHHQPELAICHSCECLHTFTTCGELSCTLLNLIYIVTYSIYFPMLFFPPPNLIFVRLIHVNICHSRSLTVRCHVAFLCVNMPHLIHFPVEEHTAYSPSPAIMNNIVMSILTWPHLYETSLGQWFSNYIRVT